MIRVILAAVLLNTAAINLAHASNVGYTCKNANREFEIEIGSGTWSFFFPNAPTQKDAYDEMLQSGPNRYQGRLNNGRSASVQSKEDGSYVISIFGKAGDAVAGQYGCTYGQLIY